MQVVVLIDCEADGYRADILPGYFVFFDERLIGSAAVLSGCGGGEVPFYVGGSADQGDVVEIDYLGILLISDFRR